MVHFAIYKKKTVKVKIYLYLPGNSQRVDVYEQKILLCIKKSIQYNLY